MIHTITTTTQVKTTTIEQKQTRIEEFRVKSTQWLEIAMTTFDADLRTKATAEARKLYAMSLML